MILYLLLNFVSCVMYVLFLGSSFYYFQILVISYLPKSVMYYHLGLMFHYQFYKKLSLRSKK